MLLQKAEEKNGDPQMAFLNYRNTPLQPMHASPPQLLMGRRRRTSLPTAIKRLQQKVVNAAKQLEHEKQRIIANYDSRDKDLHPPKEGQDVTVPPTENGTWMKETVT